jgi:hypothetical protein
MFMAAALLEAAILMLFAGWRTEKFPGSRAGVGA